MLKRTRPWGRVGLNSIRGRPSSSSTSRASYRSWRGTIGIPRRSASSKGSNGGPFHPSSMASKTRLLAAAVTASKGSSSPAKARTEGFVQYVASRRAITAILASASAVRQVRRLGADESLNVRGHVAGTLQTFSFLADDGLPVRAKLRHVRPMHLGEDLVHRN